MTVLVRQKRILIREKLRAADVVALTQNEVLAIRVKQYYPVDKCQEIADRLMGSRLYGRYANASSIARVGQAFFESQADEEARRRYEQNAVEWIHELRRLSTPYLTPADKFRLELEELWASGARLLTLEGRKMFAGLARQFGENSEAEPHQDVLAWDAPASAEAAQLRGQLAWNTYLTVAEEGGALILWDVALSRGEYEEQRIAGSYGLRVETLPEPAAVLQPEQGEMILFNSGMVHAVKKIEAGSRITWSCFVGYRSVQDQLVMWS